MLGAGIHPFALLHPFSPCVQYYLGAPERVGWVRDEWTGHPPPLLPNQREK